METAIDIKALIKRYPSPDGGEVTVLSLSELTVDAGEQTALAGPSGTGKTTLLNIISGIITPTEGTVKIMGTDIAGLSEPQRDLFRSRNIGYVFQNFSLIPSLTAKENVMAAMAFGDKIPRREWASRSTELLKRMGLSRRINHKPTQMSSGEQQRVAVARAIANRPPIILADEPTANLDAQNRKSVMDLIRDVCLADGITLVVASHDQEVLDSFGRVINLRELEEVSAHAAANSMA